MRNVVEGKEEEEKGPVEVDIGFENRAK